MYRCRDAASPQVVSPARQILTVIRMAYFAAYFGMRQDCPDRQISKPVHTLHGNLTYTHLNILEACFTTAYTSDALATCM